jgi:hypothetical protein
VGLPQVAQRGYGSVQRFGGELRNKGRVELVECKMGVRARSLQRQLSINTMARLEINRHGALHCTALHCTAHCSTTTTITQPDADQIDSLASSCSLHIFLIQVSACLLSNAKIEYSLCRTRQDRTGATAAAKTLDAG